MDESSLDKAEQDLLQNSLPGTNETHVGGHLEQNPYAFFGYTNEPPGLFSQAHASNTCSSNLFDYSTFADADAYNSGFTADFTSLTPSVDSPAMFEPSHDLLGTAVGKELETPSGWMPGAPSNAPLASSLASREIQRSGKSWSQILADTRRETHSGLPRRRSRYRSNRLGISATPNMPISELSDDRYNPLDRYQNSPPEDDYVSMTAVAQALKSTEFEQPSPNYLSQAGDSFPGRGRRSRPGSITSGESAASSPSVRSSNSASSVSRSRSTRRRPQRTRKPKTQSDKAHVFKCTFCCDTFYKRYDWTRHEKSLHLNLETWACCPQGGSVYSSATGRYHCAYCNILDPSPEHLDAHHHNNCTKGPRRQFNRKDHLVQHLKLFHKLQTMPLLEDWKIQGPNVTSRCGFCDKRMTSWDERTEHIAAHFHAGRTMKDWRGDHEFEPDVAAKVTNAIPPYLIGNETETLVPFSSTSHVVRDHVAQISSRLTAMPYAPAPPLPPAPDVEAISTQNNDLTLNEMVISHLGRYGRQQLSMGIIPTDEMFQNEARRLLYDSEDPWNQSLVDNPEWLAAFRLLHGWSNMSVDDSRM